MYCAGTVIRTPPQPRAIRPERPAWLGPIGRELWDAWVPELERLGLLTALDGEALAMACQLYEDAVDARQRLRAQRSMIVSNARGIPSQHPDIRIFHRSLTLFRAFAADFGLTPVAREHLSLRLGPDHGDETGLDGA